MDMQASADNDEIIAEVDEMDNVIGKIHRHGHTAGHVGGKLHREVAVVLLNAKDELLIQERADYGEYDYSATGHVPYNEDYAAAAVREVHEELGLNISQSALRFIGKRKVDTQEFNSHRFVALFELKQDCKIAELRPNPAEVKSLKFISMAELMHMIKILPKKFSPGFIEMFDVYRRNSSEGLD